MQPIDVEEVKRVSAKLGRRNLTQPQVRLASPALTDGEWGSQELVRSCLAKSAFAVDERNKLRAAVREERRKLFEAREAESAKNLATDEIGLRRGLENLRQAERLVAQPLQAQLVTLDQPFLIWQYPRLDRSIFLDSGIAPNNSFIKVKVDVHAGDVEGIYFAFHFLWRNQSEFTAVIKTHTSLIFNGFCLVEADTGFPLQTSWFQLGASHTVWRWSGWGQNPVTGDQTQIFAPFIHDVAHLNVTGGVLPGDVGFATQELNFQPFFLNANPIAIPPFATIMYQVRVDLDYGVYRFWPGEDKFDKVQLDFATDDLGRRIICPGVVLEVSTFLPSTST